MSTTRDTHGDPAPSAEPAVDSPATPAAPVTQPNSTPPASEPTRVEDLPEWAQKLIAEKPTDDAGRPVDAKAALAAIAVALGQNEAEDPAKLAADATAALREKSVELAVYQAAGKHSADAGALLDSRSFLATVANLDPTAKDFPAKVDAAIKTAVETNAALKTVGQSPGRSGKEITPTPGSTDRPKNLTEAVSRAYQRR